MTALDAPPVLIGREAETARLFRLLDSVRTAGHAPAHVPAHVPAHAPGLVLSGDPGAGKTALLAAVVRRAEAHHCQVLRAVGSESEARLPFAALHQLLRPVLGPGPVPGPVLGPAPGGAERSLPERQRAALDMAFGLREAAAPPDPMLLGLAVLTLLSGLAERTPLLVVVDDAQWIDRASLDALSFAARRLHGEPVVLLAGVRSGELLPGFDRDLPLLALGPLDGAASHRLLDQLPQPPSGRRRMRVLSQAGGNPLALLELARTPEPYGPVVGPLPLTGRIERLYVDRLEELPEETRHALLSLAAADSVEGTAPPTTPLAAPPAPHDGAWTPAEEAGLVRATGGRVRFRHPLVRSAVYHAAPPDARREAHRALAADPQAEEDRRAWHLAAAALPPDAAASAALERTASRALRRGGHAAAAAALERAAQLAPDAPRRARLLAEAAETAVLTGQLGWVRELAEGATQLSDDPALHASVELRVGQLMVFSSQHSAAFALLAGTARTAAGAPSVPAPAPALALEALAAAAVVAFYTGDASQRTEIRRMAARFSSSPDGSRDPLNAAPHTGSDTDTAGTLTWVRAVTDPYASRPGLVTALPRLIADAADRPARLLTLAITAWLLDETALAVHAFDEALGQRETSGALPAGLGGAAGWAYLERGRWAQARLVCSDIIETATATGLDHASACAFVVEATLLALTGDTSGARARAAEALTLVDPLESRSIAVYARRVLGTAALAEGDHATAYEHFRRVFTQSGDPVHYHASSPAVADLAASAARSGRTEEAAALVERVAAHCAAAEGGLSHSPSPRLAALLHRARALLAATEDAAEPHFRAALATDDDGSDGSGRATSAHRPFERAQTLLDYAAWLRRRRRIAEARPLLTEALETFRRLGAHPWVTRTQAELRASGVSATAAEDAPPHALADLTPQQQEIVRLAAGGLTNREIAAKLFLSPRTVSSHLYRSFPKLGVTARSQLRDLHSLHSLS
ncbi:LuxR family transcriptional regulator [Streptomyces sp. N2-109]|uniref:LuxR family transcriptional regulator n=1 Tax=Streptomyces gossypii TaxID=2883101 RepID=A0ABT2JZ02_9ACTN|nr:LuxR family transcriptional regulator [Streptomyces gossypii]MCT2593071.1 LuxR family transcriptional regulator [Streptomyces gossypii]